MNTPFALAVARRILADLSLLDCVYVVFTRLLVAIPFTLRTASTAIRCHWRVYPRIKAGKRLSWSFKAMILYRSHAPYARALLALGRCYTSVVRGPSAKLSATVRDNRATQPCSVLLAQCMLDWQISTIYAASLEGFKKKLVGSNIFL